MSRTDVHRPWRVQVADPANRFRIYDSGGWGMFPRFNACGCRMCTGQLARKMKRRSERSWWKSQRVLILTDRSERDWPDRFEGKW
jgi:3'-phosphoadenosine 5'-phosphosulfate sulfotransferase (PAPS reductase)/FAD synthetase